MAVTSVGQIGLDLVVNRNGFDRQMAGIQGIAKKAAAALAGAFAIGSLIDFGRECIELGSDLTEVQNVVDVTFQTMSEKVNEFAENAYVSFGISETMAKRFAGTFGAMAQAFGITEQEAYEMSTALTGLSGDIASFYNISQDEAYTKLKSVFTGETEALKDLGVVMTQTALDQFALANGFGKTTTAMSEAEKVMLRYAFVQDRLSMASGDFLRTSDGWANQIRYLQLQFDSLKATIGQGLINALTPVIKVINTVIGKLMSLANAFRSLTAMLFGSSGGAAVAKTAGTMKDLAESATGAGGSLDNTGKSAGGAGKAAKKAAKDIKTASMGIDELNVISSPQSGDSGSGSGGAGGGSGGGDSSGGYEADTFDMGEQAKGDIEEIPNKLQKIIDKAKELKDIFMQGFLKGLGDTSVLEDIKTSIQKIKSSLTDIFNDSKVLEHVDAFTKDLFYAFGMISGSVVSIGLTIADNLLGGLAIYLESNKNKIKQHLISMFDISGDIAMITAHFVSALADIFTIFRSDTAKQITADIIDIFSTGFMGVLENTYKFARDVLDAITTPVNSNTGKIKAAFQGVLEEIEKVTSTISRLVKDTVDTVSELYNNHVSPLMESFKTGLAQIVERYLTAFNTHILPVLQVVAEKFSLFISQSLQPLIFKFLEFSTKVIACIKVLWENVLKPFVLWFIENMAPKIGNILENVASFFIHFWEGVNEVIGYLLEALGGLIDFLIGVFSGDWKKAWQGIQDFFEGVVKTIFSVGKLLFQALLDAIKIVLESIKSDWEMKWNAIKGFTQSIWNGLKTWLSTTWEAVKGIAKEKFEAIKTKIDEAWKNLKTATEKIWNDIQKWISNIWEKIKNIFKPADMESIGRNIMDNLLSGMKSVWGDISSWIDGIANTIKTAFDEVVEGAKNIARTANNAISGSDTDSGSSVGGTKRIVSRSTRRIKAHALGGFPDSGQLFVANENGVPELVGSWGGKTAVANNMQITQGIAVAVRSGMHQALNTTNTILNRLVERATPQLSLVGNNKGEVGYQIQNTNTDGLQKREYDYLEHQENTEDLLKRIANLIESMDLTVNIDIRDIKKRLSDLDRRAGYNMRIG